MRYEPVKSVDVFYLEAGLILYVQLSVLLEMTLLNNYQFEERSTYHCPIDYWLMRGVLVGNKLFLQCRNSKCGTTLQITSNKNLKSHFWSSK